MKNSIIILLVVALLALGFKEQLLDLLNKKKENQTKPSKPNQAKKPDLATQGIVSVEVEKLVGTAPANIVGRIAREVRSPGMSPRTVNQAVQAIKRRVDAPEHLIHKEIDRVFKSPGFAINANTPGKIGTYA